MNKDTSVDDNIARIKKGWLDYGKKVARSRKPYNTALKIEAGTPLGPASQALLDRINLESGVVHTLEVIAWAKKRTRIKKNEYWWFTRIVALAIEGHIESGVDRTLDIVHVYFQRKEAEP